MKDSSLEPLKKMAASIAEASSQEKIASLNRAFELFSHEAERIENAYNSLKEEFTAIHQELEKTNIHLKKKVAELNVMTDYMENILSNISQGLVFIDLNGDITTYNAAAEEIFNLNHEKILFRNYWQNFEDDSFGFSMRKALATKAPPPLSFTSVKGEGGELKELEVTATFVFDSGTKVKDLEEDIYVRSMEGIIILIRDITLMKTLEIIAKRSDRMKELGAMAASVAHEIRNPLGGIKGFASLLKRDLENDPEKKKFAEYIIQGADTLNRLVTSILDYSKPVNLKKIPMNLQETILETMAVVQADRELFKNIHIVVEMPDKLIELTADKELLKTAFLNLMVNAIQAMPGGGTLKITARLHEASALVEFEDTGMGIPKENIGKLFTPFFTTKAEGYGFGLAEVLKTVQAHGGDIKVSSEEGKGTSFSLKLPMRG
ncbi:two-component system sensor histidine kinase NtrB [Estrella lausannensis]|uniref:histidine kinase n=1 Tax=Estrella lausannensis TaxID=483423 RepID=A0A0H5E3J4_9BACT|nr:ATP-binding protein [Estrella lausannensis]CRX37785.1 signal transduction histidine-protein kinase AtoS [Estrella lausannensis]